MTTPFTIDRETGTVHIGAFIHLKAGQSKLTTMSLLSEYLTDVRNHCRDTKWLHLDNLSFGGQPATLVLCFLHDRLSEGSWSVQLPNSAPEGGWPTREAIDAEIAFVRKMLANSMDLHPGPTKWGEIWSTFDAQGFLAANGFRYRSA